jgi:Zn finger protein HypA/HybF involved in hydrogenase expression
MTGRWVKATAAKASAEGVEVEVNDQMYEWRCRKCGKKMSFFEPIVRGCEVGEHENRWVPSGLLAVFGEKNL